MTSGLKGVKGAYTSVTCKQIIFIWLMLMERAFTSRNREVESAESVHQQHAYTG